MTNKEHKSENASISFEEVWKSLEEQDKTDVYKRAREMADIAVEQLEYAYNSGYETAKAKYTRPQGEWLITAEDNEGVHRIQCPFCRYEKGSDFIDYIIVTFEKFPPFCESCGAELRGDKNEV